jgi:hypothetical protein
MIGIASLFLGNEWARLGMVAVFCFGFGWVKAWNAFPRVDVAAIERNAIAGRDGEWERKLAEANQHHDQLIAAALEAAQGISVAADADLVSLCNKSADCRDKGGQRK